MQGVKTEQTRLDYIRQVREVGATLCITIIQWGLIYWNELAIESDCGVLDCDTVFSCSRIPLFRR